MAIVGWRRWRPPVHKMLISVIILLGILAGGTEDSKKINDGREPVPSLLFKDVWNSQHKRFMPVFYASRGHAVNAAESHPS